MRSTATVLLGLAALFALTQTASVEPPVRETAAVATASDWIWE